MIWVRGFSLPLANLQFYCAKAGQKRCGVSSWAAAGQQLSNRAQAGATLAKEICMEMDVVGILPVVSCNRLCASRIAALGILYSPLGQGEEEIHLLNLAGWCKGEHCSLLAARQGLVMVFLVVPEGMEWVSNSAG